MAKKRKKTSSETHPPEAEDLFRTISELTSDYAYVLDVAGDGTCSVQWVTEGFEQVTGYRSEDLRGWFETLIHPEDRPKVDLKLQRLLDRRPDSSELRLVTRGRETRWILDHSHPRWDEAEERVVGIYGAVQDITRQKLLQEQLLHSQKMETIGRLAGGIAHDFNNILTAVIGNLDLLGLEAMSQDERDFARSEARAAAVRASDLTRRLLTFARKQPHQPRRIFLDDFLRELESMLYRLLGEDIRLAFSLGKNVWPIRMDRSLLTQVFVNLAVNARDAMPSGGTLTIVLKNCPPEESAVVQCEATDGGERPGEPQELVKVMIRDTGKGMSDEVRGHLFEPFFTTKLAGKGTGLGLSTVYGIVQQAGGSIMVSSEIGSGTIFKIYLPREPGEEAKRTSSELTLSQELAVGRELPGGEETILVVEDDEAVRRTTVKSLIALGYDVLQAPDGFTGLLLSRGHTGEIDALISDLVMPQMNGVEFAEQLCSERPDLKVLFVSGYAELELIERGIRTFGAKFLPKPFPLSELAGTLYELLRSGDDEEAAADGAEAGE